MSRANPTAIGAFVLGAVVLFVVGVVAFGGGRIFADTTTYVLFFDDSVTGLSPGAPVEFRGVKVGEVTSIRGVVEENLDIDIPVEIELGGGRITPAPGAGTPDRDQLMPLLIQRGLRGQLGLQSFVTGQLMVTLDFMPDRPAVFRGDGRIPEIPTVPSPLTEFQERLKEIPLREIANEMVKVLQSIEDMLQSDALRAAISNFADAMKSADGLASSLDDEIDPLSEKAQQSLDDLSRALASVRRVSDNVNGRVGPLSDAATDALSLAAEGSPTRYNLDQALIEVSAAARSIRILADYLESHPEAFFSGKTGGE